MVYKNYNKNNDDIYIKLSNELIDYYPESVKDDKYYKVISNPLFDEICYKNHQVMRGILHKSELSLEDYTDLVQAIGYMTYDYYKRRFTPIISEFLDKNKGYSFSVDTDTLIDIALGKTKSNTMWCSKRRKNEIWIIKYKYNKSGELIECRSNKVDEEAYNVSGAYVVHIGMLKMYVSDSKKKVYCLSTDNEYFYVKKTSDNKYFAFGNVA